MEKSHSFLALESTEPLKLCEPLTARHDEAVKYIPPDGLAEAIDVAMMLGEPLVLTGAPGAGKTQAAKWLAHQLNAGEVLRFDVKSTTLGNDLLYTFDDVARFRDAAAGRAFPSETKPLVRYVRFNALGEGILRAAGRDSVLSTVSGEELKGAAIERHRKLLDDAFGPEWQPDGDEVRVADLLPDDTDLSGPGGGRKIRVVLIDELDKAPRDTPNDLLVEVENMTFLIAELGLRVKTDRAVRPIVVITSNAEKPLPEPFLRRCAYFNLPRVRGDKLKDILRGSLQHREVSPDFLEDVSKVTDMLHESQDAIHRKPGTAEVLAWSEILAKLGAGPGLKAWVKASEGPLAQSLTALLKHSKDQTTAYAMIRNWAGARAT
jgi:MoxR-like ATPase